MQLEDRVQFPPFLVTDCVLRYKHGHACKACKAGKHWGAVLLNLNLKNVLLSLA